MSAWVALPSSTGTGDFFARSPQAEEPTSFNTATPPLDGGYNYGGFSGNIDGIEETVRNTTCRYCKEEGHMARECPSKPANDGACFNCGEQGHTKADCTNPRKFTGTCHVCQKDGHHSRDCPDKPPEKCRNCQEEGHVLRDCTNNRKLDRSHVKNRNIEEAWNDLQKASDEEDFEAFKDHIFEYIKASPGTRMNDLESAFRVQKFNFYLYALTIDVTYDKCLVGPNGEPGCQFIWTLNRSVRPRRSKSILPRMADTPAENLERLKKAGTLEDEIGPICHVCKEKGHTRSTCEVERDEDEYKLAALKCSNCQGDDHRLRDCPMPRKNYDACRNCGEDGHKATDCDKPRVASADTECRKCGGKGHFSKECPENGGQGSSECYNCGEDGHRSSECQNPRIMKCRNCDERGHAAKECPRPRDVSRVKCNQCGQMGHFSRNCHEKPASENDEENNLFGSDFDGKPVQDSSERPSWVSTPRASWDSPLQKSWDGPSKQGSQDTAFNQPSWGSTPKPNPQLASSKPASWDSAPKQTAWGVSPLTSGGTSSKKVPRDSAPVWGSASQQSSFETTPKKTSRSVQQGSLEPIPVQGSWDSDPPKNSVDAWGSGGGNW